MKDIYTIIFFETDRTDILRHLHSTSQVHKVRNIHLLAHSSVQSVSRCINLLVLLVYFTLRKEVYEQVWSGWLLDGIMAPVWRWWDRNIEHQYGAARGYIALIRAEQIENYDHHTRLWCDVRAINVLLDNTW
jgi:hypothetical protein